MKKMTKISAAIASLLLVGAANAATPGAYVGIGAGASILRTSAIDTGNEPGVSSSESRGGLGGRVFAGYNFNKYFGLETALATYAKSTNKVSFSILGVNETETEKYTLNALSLVGKAYLPLADTGLSLYALGGAAEVQSTIDGKLTGVISDSASKTTRSLRPTYGIGASYDMTDHLTSSVELSRIQGKGDLKTSASAIPNAEIPDPALTSVTISVNWFSFGIEYPGLNPWVFFYV